jgi:hypothetical protein
VRKGGSVGMAQPSMPNVHDEAIVKKAKLFTIGPQNQGLVDEILHREAEWIKFIQAPIMFG